MPDTKYDNYGYNDTQYDNYDYNDTNYNNNINHNCIRPKLTVVVTRPPKSKQQGVRALIWAIWRPANPGPKPKHYTVQLTHSFNPS